MGIITEKKKIKIDNECKDFPLYLVWLNKLGGYDQWLFFKSHKKLTKTKQENMYIKYVPDLETSLGQQDITGKSAAPEIQFGAYVHEDDMDGMTSLYESPKVLLLTNPETWQTDGDGGTPLPKWIRVLIKPGSLLKFQSKQHYITVKMTMTLPLINTQKE